MGVENSTVDSVEDNLLVSLEDDSIHKNVNLADDDGIETVSEQNTQSVERRKDGYKKYHTGKVKPPRDKPSFAENNYNKVSHSNFDHLAFAISKLISDFNGDNPDKLTKMMQTAVPS